MHGALETIIERQARGCSLARLCVRVISQFGVGEDDGNLLRCTPYTASASLALRSESVRCSTLPCLE